MQNLVIFTTAIPRGDLHKESIGLIYEYFDDYLKKYNINHIINLDFPDKIKPLHSKKYTIELFSKLINKNVNKVIIESDKPSFCGAYKNLLKNKNWSDNNNIYWWLEDDWKPILNYNFINLFNFLTISNSAITFTDKAYCGSFRGGPIMNQNYFSKYFDIHKEIDITKDPEVQVRNNIKNKKFEGNIHFTTIYLLEFLKDYFPFVEENSNIYKKYWKNINFVKKNKLKFSIILIENVNDEHFYYYEYDNFNLKVDKIENLKKIINKISFKNFKKSCDINSLNYFHVVPHIFKDIGRNFNKNNNLIKKKGIQTYL